MILETEKRIKEFSVKNYWLNKTIHQIFSETKQKYANEEALIDPFNRLDFTIGKPQRFTYGQCDEKIDKLATVFINNGIKKDDIIGVFLPNIHELPLTLLALAKIGAIVSPYPPQARELAITKMSNFTKLKAIVTVSKFKDRNLVKLTDSVKNEIPSLELIFAFGETDNKNHIINIDKECELKRSKTSLKNYVEKLTIDPNEIYSICWTSGTTGTPKGVPRSHNLWSAIAIAVIDGAKMTNQTVFFNPFPMINMAGIGGALLPWLISGCKMVIHQPFDLPIYLKQIQKEKVEYTLAPPAILNLLLKNESILKDFDITSLKTIGSGSSPLSPWVIKSFSEKYNIDITNFFGSNEGTCLLGDPQSIPDLEKRALYFPAFGLDKKNFNHIRAQRGIESKIVDLTTNKIVVNPGDEGELYLKGPMIFTGYYKAPETNKAVFDNEGFFKTGDVFRIIQDDKGILYYEFIERNKDIIIRGGFNIAPSFIESLLHDFDKIKECAAVGYPDEVLGERIALFVVKKEEVNLQEIKFHLISKKISSYKLPEKLIFIDEIPKNPLGKILRKELRKIKHW